MQPNTPVMMKVEDTCSKPAPKGTTHMSLCWAHVYEYSLLAEEITRAQLARTGSAPLCPFCIVILLICLST